MIGEVVGSYRIVSELGKGGMGVVYAAEHVQLGKPVAVKMLQAQMSSDPRIVQRFFNEARAASAIEHPGIVEIFDFGKHVDGSAYIVMALLRGQSLDHRLLYGALHPVEGASICAQVAAALSAAHARGIVHRDLKPDNIFLVPNELMPDGVQVKLLDFGIAKLADEHQAGFKTQTGALLGTPAYMSPEQCMGRADLDHRTDLYSLGCILFHVLTGRPPFLSDHGTGVMIAAHMRDPAPHPRSINPAIPDSLAAITIRLLEKDPAARFQTAAEVRAALVGAGAHAPVTKPGAAIDQFGATMAGMPAPSGPVIAQPAMPSVAHVTTVGGSAAQVMPPPPSQTRSRKGLWIGLAAALVIGGTAGAVGFAASRNSEPSSAEDSAKPVTKVAAAPIEQAKPVKEPAKPADEAKPSKPGSTLAGAATCPDGQTRSDDTQGHCCWKDQAWSTAKNRCVGAPTCPAGTSAHNDECVEKPGSPIAQRPIAPPPNDKQVPVVGPSSFTLAAKAFKPGVEIAVKFPAAVSSPASSRSWICIAEAGSSPTSYAAWNFVNDGATTATLPGPTKAGAYEVRLHTEYPKKPFNVKHAVPFTVADGSSPAQIAESAATPPAQQRFSLASTRVAPGAKAVLRFPSALRAQKGERFWATVVAAGSADSSWGAYEYVPAGARSMALAVPTNPGDFEIRLHANYPTKTTNVVHRIPITVE